MFIDFYNPSDSADAVKMRSETARSAYLGGGTILNSLEYEKALPEEAQAQTLINLAKLSLNRIELTPSELIIGSGVTLQELLEHPDVFPAVKEAAALVVNRNIRNIATVGGNVASGLFSPCVNVASMFLAMDAELELETENGRKIHPLAKYYGCDPHKAEKCLILSVRIPRRAAEAAYALRRYVRTQNDISILLAYALVSGCAERIEKLSLVMGGCAAHPIRLSEIEERLAGQALPDRDALAEMIRPLIHPIDDLRGSCEFKTEVGAQIGAWTVYKALGKL